MLNRSMKLEKEMYISPDIKVFDIEVEQSILSSGSGTGIIPDMPSEPW